MDTATEVMPVMDRAYSDASDTCKPRIIVVPTTPILKPIDPVRVSEGFGFTKSLAMNVVCDAVVEFYSNPTAEVLRKMAGEFNTMARAIEEAGG